MRRTIAAFILIFGILFSAAAQVTETSGPMDLVVLLDTSASMSGDYQKTREYLIGPFLKEFLRIGDTVHLIGFSNTQRLEISRRIEGVGDVETVIGRLLLLYPLDPESDIPGALSFAEQYTASIPGDRHKKVILLSDDDDGNPAVASAVSAVSARLSRQNADLQFIQLPITGTPPTSGRPQQVVTAQPPSRAESGESPAQPQGTAQTQPQGTTQPQPQTTTQTQPPGLVQPQPQATTQGTTQTQPQGPVQPQGTAQTQPQGTAQTQPQGTTQTQSQGTTQTQPQGTTQTQPQGTTQTQPQGTTQTQPQGTRQTQPQGPTQPQPQGMTQTQPQGTTQTQPQDTTQTQPQGTTQTQPQGTMQTQPQGPTQPQPQGTAQTQPQGTIQTQPQGTAQTQTQDTEPESQRLAETQLQGTTQSEPQSTQTQPQAAQTQPQDPAQRSDGGDFAIPLPLIIFLIILGLLILALIIFFATRRLNSSPNRVMAQAVGGATVDNSARAARERQEKLDSADMLSGYAASQKNAGGPQLVKPDPVRRSMPKDKPDSLNDDFNNGPPMLSLFVEDQNTAIGKRNIHVAKDGYSFSVGGGRSDFLIFLVPVPAHLADVHFNGRQCTFIPRKPQYFPDIGSQQVPNCIGKNIRVISDKNYELFIRIERYEDPLKALNKLLHSIQVPGQ